MKSRKLISLLSATAMSVSAFSGLALTASAAEPVWSYDGTDTSVFGTEATEGTPGVAYLTDEMGQYVRLYARGSSTYAKSVSLPSDAQLEDNYVIEYDVKMNQPNGMGRYGRYNQVAFISSGTATKDSRDYGPYAQLVNESGVTGGNTGSETGQGYTSGVASSVSMRFGLEGAIVNDDGSEILALDNTCVSGFVSNKWVRVQAAVSGEDATVTIIDAEGNTLVNAQQYNNTADAIDTLFVTTGRGDGSDGVGDVCLDNIRIYSGTAEALTTDGLRGENTGGIIYETVPVPVAPEGLNLVSSENFDSVSTGRVALMGPDGETDREENYDVARFWCEANDDATGANNWTVVANSATDPSLGANNYIAANSGMRSSGARGPKFQFNYGEIAERETVVAQFATRLHASTDHPAEVIFLGDLVSSTSKQNMAAPLAMITTDADAGSEVYDVDNALVKGGANVIEVPDNTWVTVTIEAYRGEGRTTGAKISVTVDDTTTYIYGSETEYTLMQDSTRSGINTLPAISFRSGNSDDYYAGGNASNTSNDVDNIAVYSSNADEPVATPAPVVTMTVDETAQSVSLTSDVDATVALVQASYVTDGTLDSIKVVPVTLTADTADVSTVEDGDLDAFQTNDKFMVVDSLDSMRPLSVAYTVSGGAEQTTPAPIPTVEATTEPTEVASAEPTEVASAEPTEDADITLVHTGYVTSGSSMGTAGVSIDTADGNELFNSWGGGSASAYGQVAYAQFTIGDDVPTEGVASLDFTVTITGAADDSNARTTSVYLMPDTFPSLDEIGDDTTVTAQGTLLGNIEGTVGEATAYTFKITDQTTIETILGQDKVILGVTDRGKGGSMAGINSTTPPTLTLVEGEQVTLTTKVGGTATAGITVKIDGVEYTSDDNGVISLLLPVGDHTYEVEAGVYEAIAATSFTVATETGYTGDINLTESSVTVVADREVPGGVTSLYEWPTTTERGESTILYPTVTRVNFSEQTEETYTDFTLDFDICVLDGQAVSMGAQKANNLGTMLSFSGANGVLTLNAVESTSSSKAIAPAEGNLATGTWYNVKAEYTTVDNVTNGITVTVSSVDEAGTVGAQVAQLSGIATRNNDKGAYDNVNFNEVTGAPMLNNIYVYKTAAAAE
mgnify:CR=1 FL=1